MKKGERITLLEQLPGSLRVRFARGWITADDKTVTPAGPAPPLFPEETHEELAEEKMKQAGIPLPLPSKRPPPAARTRRGPVDPPACMPWHGMAWPPSLHKEAPYMIRKRCI